MITLRNLTPTCRLRPEPRIAGLNLVLIATVIGASLLAGTTHGHTLSGSAAHRADDRTPACALAGSHLSSPGEAHRAAEHKRTQTIASRTAGPHTTPRSRQSL